MTFDPQDLLTWREVRLDYVPALADIASDRSTDVGSFDYPEDVGEASPTSKRPSALP